MAIVKLRIQAESKVDADEAIEYLVNMTSGAAKMGKPREGSNPKYEGQQKWMSYGELDLLRRKGRKRIPF